MMRFEGQQMADQFKAAFGTPIGDVTPEQLRWLICFGKHIRGRCRSNAALRNYLAANFIGVRIREVPREWKGREYMALEISSRLRKDLAPVVEEPDSEGGDS